MYDALSVKILQAARYLGHPEAHGVFRKRAAAVKMNWEQGHKNDGGIIPNREWRTTQVPAQHQVQHEETVLVVLEGITHVHHEGVVDLVDYCQHQNREFIFGLLTSSNKRRS